MSFKDFSTAQKTPYKDADAGKLKSAVDALEPTKQSDKNANKDTPLAKD